MIRTFKFYKFYLVIFLILASSAYASEPIILGGSTTVTNFAIRGQERVIENKAGVYIEILPSSSGRGILALHQGKIDIGMISTELENIVEKYKNQGILIDADSLEVTPLNQTSILFITHQNNPITEITKEQAKNIFTGEITDWSELGFNAASIRVVSEHPTGGIFRTLVNVLLDGQPIKEDRITMQNAPQVALVVSQLPHSFGFLSEAIPEEQRRGVKILETPGYNLRQSLYLVRKKDDKRDEVTNIINTITELNK